MEANKKQIGILRVLILTIIFIGSAMSFSQIDSKKDKLIYHSFSLTPLEAFFNEYVEGFAISCDLSYAYRRNVFSVSATLSEEFNLLGGGGDRFHQLNILYGREFKLLKRLFFDAHSGFGLFLYNDVNSDKQIKLGLPLVSKLRFKTGDEFSIGIKAQANINSISNLYTLGILLQWNID